MTDMRVRAISSARPCTQSRLRPMESIVITYTAKTRAKPGTRPSVPTSPHIQPTFRNPNTSAGPVTTRPQPQLPADQLKPAPKIFKEDTYIDWNRPSAEIHNKVRGLCPSPCACTRIRSKKGSEEQIKLFETQVILDRNEAGKPGTIRIKLPDTFAISTIDGEILVNKLQWQGKSRLDIEAFLRGFHPENYDLGVF